MNVQYSARIAQRAVQCMRGSRFLATKKPWTPPNGPRAKRNKVATPASTSKVPITSSEILPTPEAPKAPEAAAESLEPIDVLDQTEISQTPEASEAAAEFPEPTGMRGQTIYIFHHVQKNHVVYSLQRAMKNNHALRQLPYNGKKTVPRALRKDLWAPLATLSFPSPEHGRSVFQKLREYRRRHELEWDPATMPQYFDDKEKTPIPRQKRGRFLMDQKGNSIADIAAVLTKLDVRPAPTGKRGSPEKVERLGLLGEGQGVKVGVKWVDLANANFAGEWSPNVIHESIPDRMFKAIKGTDEIQTKKALTAEQKDARRAFLTEAKEKNQKKQVKQAAKWKALKKAGRRKATFAVNKWQRAALAQGGEMAEAGKGTGETPVLNTA